jgi:hypothetical protein
LAKLCFGSPDACAQINFGEIIADLIVEKIAAVIVEIVTITQARYGVGWRRRCLTSTGKRLEFPQIDAFMVAHDEVLRP